MEKINVKVHKISNTTEVLECLETMIETLNNLIDEIENLRSIENEKKDNGFLF